MVTFEKLIFDLDSLYADLRYDETNGNYSDDNAQSDIRVQLSLVASAIAQLNQAARINPKTFFNNIKMLDN